MNTSPQDDPYGEHLPMNVVQEMWRGDPVEIPINEPVVSSSEVISFTGPRLSDSAPVRGRNGPFNVGNTPTMRFTGDAAQMSGMRVGSSYYDRIEMSTPPNGNPGHTMSIPTLHQSWSSPRFPSIHQAQSLISMQSSDSAEPSSHTNSFDGFEHTMGASSSHPDQYTNFIQNPYYAHLMPSGGTPSSVQGGHSSRSTCIYESAPTVGFSGRSHYDWPPPTTSDMCTASYDQVRPSFITPGAYGYGHGMGISTSYLNQPTVFMQDPYHGLVQPSIGMPSQVQVLMPSSGSAPIDKSAPSIGTSGLLECQECHKIFSCEYTLGRHSMVHSNERPFECEVCYFTFARKDHLKTHYNRVHLNMTRFKCEACAQSFYFKYELDKHDCSMR